MNKIPNKSSTINLNVSENHKLLYYTLPKVIIQKLQLTDCDLLEYDVRENQFFIRKKGSNSKPTIVKHNLFTGLLVERNITRNNTVLRTNLPKEVAQPLDISKGDNIEILLDGEVIIGRKKT
ncbi:MAG: AbrB/MazE/SpoVT family DNA-binding domain-containing protein [Asgard group archaeon]|nr:AbrB/MazE/SpoVT family DNA-binding domain-containing protein [Asgard group archaeon]